MSVRRSTTSRPCSSSTGRPGGLSPDRLAAGQASAFLSDPLPLPLEYGDAVGLGGGQVFSLAAIAREVVELPGGAAGRDDFPVAHPHRPVPFVAPPERVVGRGRLGARKRRGKTPALQRRRRRLGHSRELEHRRHEVDRVHGLAAKLPLGRDPLGPVDNPGRRDAAFVARDPSRRPSPRGSPSWWPETPAAQARAIPRAAADRVRRARAARASSRSAGRGARSRARALPGRW